MNRMRETIEEAEPTEPLLAEQLYDTARKTQEQNLDRALEAAEASLRHGLSDDARGQEQIANKGIGELRAGIERAAQSVLGDDTEALRHAREELDRLADQLSDEIARNTGEDLQPTNRDRGDGQDDHRSPHAPSEEGTSPRGDEEPLPESGRREPAQSNWREQQRQQAQSGQSDSGRSPEEQPTEGQSKGGQQPSDGGDRQNGQQRNEGGQQPGRQRGGDRNQDTSAKTPGPGGFAPFFEPGNRPWAPLTGDDFRDWSDRLRDVEEMVDDPELRAEAARIRERARGIRAEMKRHSRAPNWDLIKIDVSRPLYELRDRVAEELLRRTSRDALLPLDRDPVPPKYTEKTRRYYERLGTGR